MTLDAQCLCGNTVHIDTSKSDPSAICAICGRVVKPPKPKPSKKKKKSKVNDGVDPFADLQTANMSESMTDLSENEDKVGPTLIAVGAIVIVAFLGLICYLIAGAVNKPAKTTTFVASGTSSEGSDEGGGTGTHGTGPGSGTSGTGTGAGDHGTGTGAVEDKTNPDSASSASTEPAVEEPVAMAPKEDNRSNLPEDGINVPGITKVSPNAHRGHGIGLRGESGLAARRRNGSNAGVDAAVKGGLAWLAMTQEPDGSWHPSKWSGNDEFTLGISGLATLAFLGDGHFPGSKTPFDKNVAKSLEFILSKEDPKTGKFPFTKFYEQAICTIVLCEAYVLTNDDKLKDPAQNALNFVISNIGPEGGFGYGGPGTDTSVTGFGIMAIKSGAMADLDEPPEAIDKVKAYLEKATGDDGQTGYNLNNGVRPSMTAVGLFCRLFLKFGLDDAKVIKAASLIETQGVNVQDEYYTYYATYGMFQIGGAPCAYNQDFLDKLLKIQEHKPENLRGSFPPSTSSTARPSLAGSIQLRCTCWRLEVYSRYLPVYREESK